MPGLLMYESALIVALVFLLILNSYYLLCDEASIKRFYGNGVIWSLIPLVRPDASLIVSLNVLMLVYYYIAKKKYSLMRTTLAVFVLSVAPSLAYYSYSSLQLGTFSVSAYSRAFALREGASSLLGVHYSSAVFRLFLLSPAILFVFFAMWGFAEMTRSGSLRLLALFSGLSIAAYITLLALISLVTSAVERYSLPIIPFIALLLSIGEGAVWALANERRQYLVPMFLVLSLIILPVVNTINSAIAET